MPRPTGDHDALLKTLRGLVSALEFPQNYSACMMSASELVEEAAFCMTAYRPGHRVVELLLLAARLEELATQHDPDPTAASD